MTWGLSPGNNHIRKKADAQVKILISFIPFPSRCPGGSHLLSHPTHVAG